MDMHWVLITGKGYSIPRGYSVTVIYTMDSTTNNSTGEIKSCLNKRRGGWEFVFNHLLSMDDLKLYGKFYKQIDSLVDNTNIKGICKNGGRSIKTIGPFIWEKIRRVLCKTQIK